MPGLTDRVTARKFADEYDEAVAYLDQNMVRFPRKSAWWLPAHNLAVNMTLLGDLNLDVFSILPGFPKRFAYLPAGENPQAEPEGIVINPSWHPHPVEKDTFPATLEVAKTLVDFAKKQPMVGETVQREFLWIEKTFGTKIPTSIKASYAQQSPKMAVRRWGVSVKTRMRGMFVPLDGRDPVPMPSFGRPIMARKDLNEKSLRVAHRFLQAKYPPKAMDYNRVPDADGFWGWPVREAAHLSGVQVPTPFKDIGDMIFWLNMVGSRWMELQRSK